VASELWGADFEERLLRLPGEVPDALTAHHAGLWAELASTTPTGDNGEAMAPFHRRDRAARIRAVYEAFRARAAERGEGT